uniref:Uncharacterized protein n=1 Tax=Xenopus tropicalis TaxID=8364 RepID=A0A6I8RW69_XENTR
MVAHGSFALPLLVMAISLNLCNRYISPISMRGCHLGTCQIQNLASMLYRLGNNGYKDGSNRDTKDPLGYGRRRRSLQQNKKRTDLPGMLLAT